MVRNKGTVSLYVPDLDMSKTTDFARLLKVSLSSVQLLSLRLYLTQTFHRARWKKTKKTRVHTTASLSIVGAHFFQRAVRGADPSAASPPPKNT